MSKESFDLILVGSGFASLFFLRQYLTHFNGKPRILILERGLASGREAVLQSKDTGTYTTNHTEKDWLFTFGVGGGSNCWWACTPRFMENDFKMKTTYGVGQDWPIQYDDLEHYYSLTESIMSVSGPEYGGFFKRSQPYPQPPHRFSSVDEVLKSNYPDTFYQQPTARAFLSTKTRAKCCASGVCHQCPISAKFMLVNDLKHIFEQDSVTLKTGCEVKEILYNNTQATGVRYQDTNKNNVTVTGDVIGLGANGIFNPFLLQKSGLNHPKLGKGINDQISHYAYADLTALSGFNGSTSVTGHGYMWYDGPHRKDRAACLLETSNVISNIRLERGKYQQRVNLKFVFEDLSSDNNYVQVDKNNAEIPAVVYEGYSDYTQKGIDYMKQKLPELLHGLPVESIVHLGDQNKTEAHIQGTTVMGKDPALSIVDENQVHHKLRNLLVLGSGVFPTSPPANPTLTLSALSLRAADKLMG